MLDGLVGAKFKFPQLAGVASAALRNFASKLKLEQKREQELEQELEASRTGELEIDPASSSKELLSRDSSFSLNLASSYSDLFGVSKLV